MMNVTYKITLGGTNVNGIGFIWLDDQYVENNTGSERVLDRVCMINLSYPIHEIGRDQ